jgi:hypothetical protein
MRRKKLDEGAFLVRQAEITRGLVDAAALAEPSPAEPDGTP